MTEARPIGPQDIAAVADFLHERMNPRITAKAWLAALTQRWTAAAPNHGWQLRDAGRLVGVFCAIYSDQPVAGRLEKFCNLHSWCVLPEHRASSMHLVLPLLRQQDYHFTLYTPNPTVAAIFLGLGFRRLEDRLVYTFNAPHPGLLHGGRFVEDDPQCVVPRLHGAALDDYGAHQGIPWLHFVAFGQGDDVCLAIYKRERWKRMPCAQLLHISDHGALRRHGALLRHHLLIHRRLPACRIEGRFLKAPPALSIAVPRTQTKLVRSATLADEQIGNLYTEIVALDL